MPTATKKILPHRSQLLIEELQRRVLVLDGAMGTSIQQRNLAAADFGGASYEGCNEYLVLTNPKVISDIHAGFAQAGADILETNTFGATPLVLAEYDLADKAAEINLAAATIARQVADRFATVNRPIWVAGAIGPTTKALSLMGGVSFADMVAHYQTQVAALIEGGVDYLLIETSQDSRNIKAALLAIDEATKKAQIDIPVAVSITIEAMGSMLAGQSVEALYAAVEHRNLLYIGLNCATGPAFMTDHIRSLARISRLPIACVPNAGLPDENGDYLENPLMMGEVLGDFLKQGWLNLIGGCCGTEPAHIAEMARIAKTAKPRPMVNEQRSILSGIDFLEVTDELRPVIVGERTNVIGSRKFKELIGSEKFEEAAEIARAQVKRGAQIVDICMANPDRDELADMRRFLEYAVKNVRVPIMVDSTDADVIELALTYLQGKGIINSINLENGEERFAETIPLARRFGAALIVGLIDDDPQQGMGITRHRKLQIAERSYQLLTEKYGVRPEDIYWDPLVFPCATGDQQYVGSAVETIEGIRLVKQHFPGTKTVLGISNVSFGLPTAGREVLNAVFLYHCVQAGLDLAIVNSEKLERYASLAEEERRLAENLLFNRVDAAAGGDPIADFSAFYREKKPKAPVDRQTVPLDQRLAQYVIEGAKDGLLDDLKEKLSTAKAMEIINGPLMRGMDEVGRLFNDNKLIVAEVLQSAEVMKAAVSFLEPLIDKTETVTRGKVILATVKGDVHDIGKNLVEIVLANNGFDVVNLGIKVPPERLIQEIRQHQPDIVGLSGLLVKSAQQMVATADDFSKANIGTKMLVGGAALSRKFVDTRIAPAYTGTVAYASDAMHGLELAKIMVQPTAFTKFKDELAAQRRQQADEMTTTVQKPTPIRHNRSSKIKRVEQIPPPVDFKRHVLRNTPITQIWKFINPLMLYTRHLGIPGSVARQLDAANHDPKALADLAVEHHKAVEILHVIEAVKEEYRDTPIMRPVAVYQCLHASGYENQVRVWNDQGKSVTFDFPRQPVDDGLCLADYFERPTERPDHMGMFVVSVGEGVRELAEKLKQQGEYLKSHIVQALVIESAEAYAELLHSTLRAAWGHADPIAMTMMQRFQAKYPGKRYSFGYPACPNLEDQKLLWDLLNPTEIGVQLTEGCMMDPEASVSAIVIHHPEAIYFSASVGSSN